MVDFFKFTEQVNLLHPTALLAMKFTTEISDTETIFLRTREIIPPTMVQEEGRWNPSVADPDLEIRGGGGGHPDPDIRRGVQSPKRFFSALRASF